MEQKKEILLPAPLFRDPVYDCPTDPTVIWNEEEKMWYLFYTQRRAGAASIGVSWVHGTKIGVAVSRDGGKWLYRGTLEGLEIERGHNTFWAPEIIRAEGIYHMYVSYITQIANNLDGNPGAPWQPLAAFFNCVMWTLYGFLKPKKDWPIIVANVPGVVLALIAFITAFVH